jgi:UDP-N-acetylglucosamine 2-epimerase (non-hydrolysing)
MTKIISIVGTRPEIIRLSVILKKLDKATKHIVVFTGQNYDKNLNDIFWEQLKLRKPDYIIESKSNTTAEQISKMLVGIEKIILEEKPNKALILGDTYSGLTAIVCERYGVPVYHMEAGNRCWDNRVPEEKNRKVIDSVSTFNLPYTKYSYNNLKKLGHEDEFLFITGNPIYEVIKEYSQNIKDYDNKYKGEKYGVATFHRAECVDKKENLEQIIDGLQKVSTALDMKIFCSIHPRTKANMQKFNIKQKDLIFSDPVGFFEFISLEKNASLILTDSGTVSEEACILDVPCITLREVTERQELVECGSTVLSTYNSEKILQCSKDMFYFKNWLKPEGYLCDNVSDVVINKMLGK